LNSIKGPVDAESTSVYANWPFRASAAILLSGRVQANSNDQPNRTDLNRIGKEAKFNPAYLESVGAFFLRAKVLRVKKDRKGYEPGEEADAFWKHDQADLQRITHRAFEWLLSDFTGHTIWRPTLPWSANLVEFLAMFFHAFEDRAFRENDLGSTMLAFSNLPPAELHRLTIQLSLGLEEYRCRSWDDWLDGKGQEAMWNALVTVRWIRPVQRQSPLWTASPVGLAMLGLSSLPPAAALPADLHVLSNLSVLAGAGRPVEELAVLVRHCKVKHLDQVFEYQLDRRRFREASAKASPAKELGKLFHGLELPDTVADLLQTRSAMTGTVKYRQCSALIQPSSEEVRDAIRKHPLLKGFIEAGAPPGYLLLKPSSNPLTFLERCRELGLTLKDL
jgi:hypothetical protein